MKRFTTQKVIHIALTLFAFFCIQNTHGQVYVNHAATGANNGTSWNNAYADLKLAIDNTASGEIWVAKGTYYPTSGTDRTISFTLKNNLEIYGGFSGGETARTQRDYENNETVMSGDLGVASDTTDNSYHVINADFRSLYSSPSFIPASSSAILDGFTIRDGNASGTGQSSGGGIYLGAFSPLIQNCKLLNNHARNGGGGVLCNRSQAVFTNVLFEKNETYISGGGISAFFSPNIKFLTCVFRNNKSTYNNIEPGFTNGGAIATTSAIVSGNMIIDNCIFDNNQAAFRGGALFVTGKTTISNSTFKSNDAGNNIFVGEGGAIYNAFDITTITNCVFHSNRVTGDGGGGAIYNVADLNVYNSTITQNILVYSLFGSSIPQDNRHSAGITNESGNTDIRNSIIYDNTTIGINNGITTFPIINYSAIGGNNIVEYCIGKDLPNSPTNFEANPLFINGSNDFRLRSTSPAIDAGDNSAVPAGITTDIIGSDRIFGGTVDIGAYEFGACNYLSNNRIYVDANNSSGVYDGLLWASAFQDLQAALEFTATCDAVQEIWVADGTYYPTSGTDRTVSFELQDDLKIYGGFAGNETELTQRNSQNNPSILSGDIGATGSDADNSFHVVHSFGNDNTAILDGFIIEKGNANISGAAATASGGGFYGDASNAIVQNCTFKNNIALAGAGISILNPSSPQFINCVIHDNNSVNTSGFELGGGAYADDCSPSFTNCLFYNNFAPIGGGLCVDSGNTTVTNSTFTENSALIGGTAFINAGTVNMTNTISWNNSASTDNELSQAGFTVNHSIIEGGYAGTGNLNQDPLFVDAANDDFNLTSCSPAINAGTPNTAGLNLGLVDLNGNSRISVGRIDLGAYEFQPSSLPRPLTVTNTNDDGCGSLRFLVTFAAAGDTIRFSPAINGETIELVSQIILDKNLVILGNDTTNTIIDGMANSRIFEINENSNVTTDGIKMQNGRASGSASNSDGGAVFNQGTASFSNCKFVGNSADREGGAVYNDGTISFSNCMISENTARLGGGVFINGAITNFTNCTISGNSSGGWGGGVYTSGSITSFVNCTITGNYAGRGGGFFESFSFRNYFINCTIAGNSASDNGGGGIACGDGDGCSSSNFSFTNSIITKNSSRNGINIEGSFTTLSNNIIGGDPLFVMDVPTAPSTGGDLRLQATSTAIDAGDNSAVPASISTDIIGNARIFGGTVDIGAYEFGAFEACNNIVNNRIYVDTGNSSGVYDGVQWASAFKDLRNALNFATACDNIKEVWVAQGTYYPTSGTDRTRSFEVLDDIKVYGGFAGNETDIAQRDLAQNITILSGDIDHATDPDLVVGTGNMLSITGNTGNSYHVIVTANLTNAAVIDGFTIKGGYGDATSTDNYAGTTITRNDGGGIYNHNSNLTISNTIFSGNEVTDDGGGIFNQGGNPTIVNCVFALNQSASSGGGVYNTSASPTITNTTITGNSAVSGGGIRNWDNSNPSITNSIIWGNANAQILNGNSTPILSHNIIEGSGGSSAWDISFGTDDGNNLDSDPLFVDAPNGDFRLSPCSPAVNEGTTVSHTTDILGNPHFAVVDMGAYEYQGTPYTNAIYVNINASGNNNGTSWEDAYTDLQDAIDTQCGTLDIWVAAGTYLPTRDHTGNSTPTDNRDKVFHIGSDVKIYGGFAGTETALAQRDWKSNVTVLSGDFNNDDVVTGGGSTLAFANNTENAYHVLITADLTAASVLDGFTIKSGNANGFRSSSEFITYNSQTFSRINGGAMYNISSSPTISNTTFVGSNAFINGGAMFNGSSSSPTISNTTFAKNRTGINGGAMHNGGSSSPTISNTTFANNIAGNSGGAMNNGGSSSPAITNTVFANNFSALQGGAMNNNGSSSPTIANSTFVNNNSNFRGGGIDNTDGSSPTITNTIFWNNIQAESTSVSGADISGSSTVTHSLTQANSLYNDGTGIINNQDPLFVDAANEDFRLNLCSPAVNAGTPDTTGLNLGLVDLNGGSRIVAGRIDLGVFEFQPTDLPKPLMVSNTNNDGCGSLRFLVTFAASGDTIRFSPSIDGDTVKLTSGQILIDKNLTIIGNGIENSIIDGSATSRIFEIAANDTLKVNYLTIQNGKTSSSGGGILALGSLHLNYSKIDKCSSFAGGAIRSSNFDAEIIVRYSTISNNTSSWGGGGLFLKNDQTEISNSSLINNFGEFHGGAIKATRYITELNIENTTISGNSSREGGGVFICSSKVNIANSTITNNNATTGGGIMLERSHGDPTLSLKNTIVYNSASSSSPDIFTFSTDYIIDEGNNLVFSSDGGHGITSGNNLNPLLGTLQDNGGPTLTHSLLCGSPAYNAGTGTSPDQRGEAVFGGTKDIGAFESQTPPYTNAIYVNINATGNNNGTSWNDAYTDLQDAIDNRCGVFDIWVAAGTYLPTRDHTGNSTPTDNRDKVFHIGSDIKIYGGFAGTETALAQRDWKSNVTVLSGDFNNDDVVTGGGSTLAFANNTENAYHVLITADLTAASVLDGFTIKSGNASGGSGFITFNSHIFSQTQGGAMFNVLSSPTISHTIFVNNNAGIGGAMHNRDSSPTVSNATFVNNNANDGGAMHNRDSSPRITNSTFANNNAGFGGAMNGGASSPTITNSTFVNNSASVQGGGILSSSRFSLKITNTIFWNNMQAGSTSISGADIFDNGRATPSVSYSLTQENSVHSSGTGIINNEDPLFVDAANGDFSLSPCSPAINMGTADTTGLNLGLVDLDGNPRVFGGRIDMGAYEVQTEVPDLEITNRSPAEFNIIFACENVGIKIGSGVVGSAFTYQWQVDQGSGFADLTETSPYSQTTADSLIIDPITVALDGYQYRAIISNGCETITSDTVTLQVGQLPTLVSSPLTQEVCPGNEVVLEAEFTGAGFYYLWQVNNGGGYMNVSGSDYTFSNNKLIISNFDFAKNNNQYRALAKSACFEIPSNAATITINTDVTILAQPTSQTVCEFNTAIFTAQAIKLSAGTLTYQWQRKSGINWINVNTGGRYMVTGNQLQISNAPASWNGAEFRCLINDYCQTIPKTLNVIPVAHVTANPQNVEICQGNNANFTIIAAGEGLTYRWQVNTGTGFTNLTDGGIYQGATAANLSLSFPTSALNSYQYRCIVSGTSTCDLVADTSAVASINIGVSAEAQSIFYNSSISTDDGVTQAVGYILGINDIIAPNGKAEFRAGNAIILNPGFEVEAGAVFKAVIRNPCQSSSASFGGGSAIPKEVVK